jgi:SAM-dependent methyltransferase
MKKQMLKMLAIKDYAGVHKDDPIKFYNLPLIGDIYRKRVEMCLNELSGGMRVLEVGFGSGVTFLNLDEMYDEIHGIDPMSDVELVAASFKRFGIQAFLKKGDVFRIPYQENYFDSVLLISVLEHLKPESLNAAVREMRRILKRNGQLIYGVPVDRKMVSYACRLCGYRIEDYHFSDQEQVAAAVRKEFKEVSTSGLCVWPFGKLYEIGSFIKA